MAFQLPELPFAPASLQPFLSPETFEYHHGKHHAAYVKKLNDAIAGSDYESTDLEEIVVKSNQEFNKPVFNNAAQHYNHTFFWNCMSPDKPEISDNLKKQIEQSFGSIEEFKDKFSTAAAGLFGSGWTWLEKTPDGKLQINTYNNADNPLINNNKPLLTIDVWEHAYYIDYRNARPDFIKEFWSVVNWSFVESQL